MDEKTAEWVGIKELVNRWVKHHVDELKKNKAYAQIKEPQIIFKLLLANHGEFKPTEKMIDLSEEEVTIGKVVNSASEKPMQISSMMSQEKSSTHSKTVEKGLKAGVELGAKVEPIEAKLSGEATYSHKKEKTDANATKNEGNLEAEVAEKLQYEKKTVRVNKAQNGNIDHVKMLGSVKIAFDEFVPFHQRKVEKTHKFQLHEIFKELKKMPNVTAAWDIKPNLHPRGFAVEFSSTIVQLRWWTDPYTKEQIAEEKPTPSTTSKSTTTPTATATSSSYATASTAAAKKPEEKIEKESDSRMKLTVQTLGPGAIVEGSVKNSPAVGFKMDRKTLKNKQEVENANEFIEGVKKTHKEVTVTAISGTVKKDAVNSGATGFDFTATANESPEEGSAISLFRRRLIELENFSFTVKRVNKHKLNICFQRNAMQNEDDLSPFFAGTQSLPNLLKQEIKNLSLGSDCKFTSDLENYTYLISHSDPEALDKVANLLKLEGKGYWKNEETVSQHLFFKPQPANSSSSTENSADQVTTCAMQ